MEDQVLLMLLLLEEELVSMSIGRKCLKRFAFLPNRFLRIDLLDGFISSLALSLNLNLFVI